MTRFPGKFVLAPGETLNPGDWVTFGTDGKLRRAVPGVDARGFQLPPTARVNSGTGTIDWEVGDPLAPDLSRGSPPLVWADSPPHGKEGTR
jgi:hypothetical protein